jgi:hypothetical protein
MALLLTIPTLTILPAFGSPTAITCYSDVLQLGNPVTKPDVRGTTFKIAIVVEDVEDLYGFDLQFNWTTQWIHYTSYNVYAGVEDYPSPIPPSPYGGILHKPVKELMNVVNEANHIPLAEEGAMAWIGFSSQAPADSFNGSGTLFIFTFQVTDQPFDYEEPAGVPVGIHFVATALSTKAGAPISHSVADFYITLYPRAFSYPASPMLKITPTLISGYSKGSVFSVDVWLLGADGGDLDAFWDVAGCDFYLNFNNTLLEAINAVTDPHNDFGAFWAEGIFEYVNEINNGEGWVHLAFTGWGATHDPVHGQLKIATVSFRVIYESPVYPPPTEPIYLKNPLVATFWYIMDADAGLIDLSSPLNTEWTAVFPGAYNGLGFTLIGFTDKDGNGKLSICDDIVLYNEATGKWHDYYVDDLKGTLKLRHLYNHYAEEKLAMSGPTHKYSPWPKLFPLLKEVYNGTGIPYLTGNFSLAYPVQSVNYFEVRPQIGEPYNLTEGVDFRVNPDGTIELLTPLDEWVENEFVGTMPDVDLGWPALTYIASSIQSVYIIMPNGTERYANGGIFEEGPPSADNNWNEWWYEPDYPYELESWWATGYYPGPWTWPNGTKIYVNYTAPPFVYIDYNTKPDPLPYYMEWPGTYEEFLTIINGNPTGTTWYQVYPSIGYNWDVISWVDADSSGDLTVGDQITMLLGTLESTFEVSHIGTDIKVLEYPCVQDIDPNSPFYTDPIIVDIAGFPHPERPMSPWFGRNYGVPLPNAVQDAAFQAPFAAPGRSIDVYTQYPDQYNGKGMNEPSDAFGPQATVKLIALVTYNKNPVQHKPVTFQVWHGEWNFSFCNFTDENGIAWVQFGLPWPCDNPEARVFGTWNVVASVEIREVVVMDTLSFEVGWLINIISIEPSQDSYAIGEHMSFKITYNSISHQARTAYFTIVVTDDLDVPIGWLTIGPITVTYGTHDDVILECMIVPKWTFVGQGKVWVNILTNLPSRGGVQYCPEGRINIGLTIP